SAGEAAWNVRDGVVVAKSAEEIVVGRQSVVHTDVKLRLIQAAHRFAYEVVSCGGIASVWHGVEINQGPADAVDQTGRYFGTWRSLRLATIRSGWQGIATGIALEIDIWKDGGVCRSSEHVGIDNSRYADRIATNHHCAVYGNTKGIVSEVRVGLRCTRPHRHARDQPRKCDAVELILLLTIDEEKGFVLANRSPDGTSKLVQIELFWRGRKEALGI